MIPNRKSQRSLRYSFNRTSLGLKQVSGDRLIDNPAGSAGTFWASFGLTQICTSRPAGGQHFKSTLLIGIGTASFYQLFGLVVYTEQVDHSLIHSSTVLVT